MHGRGSPRTTSRADPRPAGPSPPASSRSPRSSSARAQRRMRSFVPAGVRASSEVGAAGFLSKLNDVIELKPLAGSGQGRVLRIHIANRMRQGAIRELTLYAPYWLVNQTSLPLVFREVRLGTGLLNTS